MHMYNCVFFPNRPCMVHGYRVYKSIWDAVCDDILPCKRETGNHHNPCRGTILVGHVPSKISTLCFYIHPSRRYILCRVNGSWHYSLDLPLTWLLLSCMIHILACILNDKIQSSLFLFSLLVSFISSG